MPTNNYFDNNDSKMPNRSKLKRQLTATFDNLEPATLYHVWCVAEDDEAAAGLRRCGIEYSYHRGDPLSERLLSWYEVRITRSPSSQSVAP